MVSSRIKECPNALITVYCISKSLIPFQVRRNITIAVMMKMMAKELYPHLNPKEMYLSRRGFPTLHLPTKKTLHELNIKDEDVFSRK